MITLGLEKLLAIIGATDLIGDVDEADDVNDKIGALTDAAADTASTATVIQLLRQIAEAVNNGSGASIATNKSLVDYIGAANTSSLVARIGALTDVAADTTDTVTIIALLRQIAEAVNNGSGGSIAANKSLVDYIGAANTSSLVARIGGLTDVAADTTDTATIIALLRQIAEAVNNGAGASIAAGKSLVDYLGDLSTSSLVARLGVLTDVAADTTDTATAIALLRQIAEAVNNGAGTAIGSGLSLVDLFGAFDGGADPQGDIYQALGVGAVKSIATLIGDAQAVVGLLADVADETAGTATLANQVRALLARALPKEVYKTVAFTSGVGTGDIGTVALFTVTGAVKIKITAICTETLVGAATLECGIAGSTAGIIAQIPDATALLAGELWFDATPTTEIDTVANAELQFVLANAQDIFLTIGAANITDGTVIFKIVWEPLIPTGAVVAA